MPLLENLIHRGLQLRSTLQRLRRRASPEEYQRAEFRRLVSTARDTAFGRHYDFAGVLAANDLKGLYVMLVPTVLFYDWMRRRGKLGGQNKFPWG